MKNIRPLNIEKNDPLYENYNDRIDMDKGA